eukprot:CAMPEP_0168619826 /NCGR_PEP_ID=MMETSP0449_2-20121227/6810_1 /TAXON_ID=1082188 /ORGANISM="Strombidium rassoulzadegani, Strain ras09" /LENGTH=105 /DNA_ID=CAMNT_0008660789 /DNA_START=108 /DNA_END=426 /DNA_ORIENTATION=-
MVEVVKDQVLGDQADAEENEDELEELENHRAAKEAFFPPLSDIILDSELDSLEELLGLLFEDEELLSLELSLNPSEELANESGCLCKDPFPKEQEAVVHCSCSSY